MLAADLLDESRRAICNDVHRVRHRSVDMVDAPYLTTRRSSRHNGSQIH
jgi:hypothetical protein